MQLEEMVGRLRREPVLFVRALLGEDPDGWQCEVMQAVADGETQITIRSGRQVGKTTELAWLSMWFLMVHRDARVLVTAPSSGQLEDAYIPEFKKWVNTLPPELRDCWTIKAERFEFKFDPRQPFENFITIKTARKDSPESMQGMNAPNVLVLVDEAAAVDDALFESLSGSLSGNRGKTCLFLTGNPNRTSGFFYESHTVEAESWKTFHVSSEQCSRVSESWIGRMKRKYGDDSDPYRIHVLGEFPRGESNTVIPVSLVEAAIGRDVDEIADSPVVWGLDVARFGSDSSALAKRKGNVLLGNIQTWRSLDTMQLAGLVESEYEAALGPYRPSEILVDVIGVGAGVVDRLRSLGLPVRGINVSESPSLKGQHLNLRSELWYNMKAWLEQRDVRLPNDKELMEELVSVRFEYTDRGKIKLESKQGMKKRGADSPDRADALALTFASTAARLSGSEKFDWRKPVRRLIPRLV